jgi:hypothetical protein
VAYFSSQPANPTLCATHRQLERLSDRAQQLLFAAMSGELDSLPAGDLRALTRWARHVNSQLMLARDRLDVGRDSEEEHG